MSYPYEMERNLKLFSKDAQKEILEESYFELAGEEINELWIYESETPQIFVNCNPESVEMINIISTGWGEHNVSFHDELDEQYRKRGFKADHWGIMNAPQQIAMDEERCDEDKLDDFLENMGLSVIDPFAEALIYLRQGILLEKWMKESGKFKLAPDFTVSVGIHDGMEKIPETAKKYANETMETPLRDIMLDSGALQEIPDNLDVYEW